VEISKTMDSILYQFRLGFENSQKVYGIPIHEIGIVHNISITRRMQSDSLPNTKALYKEIGKLILYAKNHGALVVDSPMLHMEKNSFHHYDIMIGIPINKEIPESESFFMKKIPLGGKILVGRVNGGYKKIDSGFKAIELYLMDVQRGSPAIPFQVLRTNRLQVPDSSRWITDLYYPVI
jgi:hypothetical protein